MQIHNTKDLEEAIITLEKRKIQQRLDLTEQFDRAKSSVMPLNLVRNSIHAISHNPEISNSALKTVAGIGVGLLTKNLFLGKATPVIKTLVEKAIERGVQNGVSGTTLAIKSYGKAIWHNLFKKSRK